VKHQRAIVVGCGVSGLSSAIRLLEAGTAVEIWTRDLPPRTTSNIAGAIWYPFKASPPEAVERWARASYREYERLSRMPDTGVAMRRGVELLPAGQPDEGARFRSVARAVRKLGPEELPAGFDRGFEFESPIVEMPVYLDWALRRVEALGGKVQERTIASLGEVVAECPLVVNCTGFASRELAGDRELFALRGQVVRIERHSIDRYLVDDFDPRGLTYVIPRSHDCVLGGTVEQGREDLVPD
jgi:D-amino-acid oxidase